MSRYVAAALVALATAAGVAAPAPAEARRRAAETRVYVIVWQVDLDAAGNVSAVAPSRVLDPSPGGTAQQIANRPVNLEIPAEQVAAARRHFEAQPRQAGSPNPFFSYTFYDPRRPDAISLSPLGF
jgi:hypothetical protein